MEGSPSAFLDWAHLPPLVVDLISEKVKSITDYVRFRAVCSPWRSASVPKPRHLPPQLPWLMLPYSPYRHDLYTEDYREDDGIRLFYDPFESKMRKLHLPETIGMLCLATDRGWLFLVSIYHEQVFLLNPLTRTLIQLPPFTTTVKVLGCDWDAPGCDASDLFEPRFGKLGIPRVTLSADPTDPKCLITVFVERCSGLFCCRAGDRFWTSVSIPFWAVVDAPLGEVTYYAGCFDLLSKGTIGVIDIESHKPENSDMRLFDKFRGVNLFLLKWKFGLHVVAVHNNEEEEEETGQNDPSTDDTMEGTEKTLKETFELYQLFYLKKIPEQLFDLTKLLEEPLDLKEITDASNTTIFYGENRHCLAVCSDDWDSVDGGSIYIEHKMDKDRAGEYNSNYYSISSAKMDDAKFKTVACGLAGEPPIGPPAPAMWFQPSFV